MNLLARHNKIRRLKLCDYLTTNEQILLCRLSNLESLKLYSTRYQPELIDRLIVLQKLNSLSHKENDRHEYRIQNGEHGTILSIKKLKLLNSAVL